MPGMLWRILIAVIAVVLTFQLIPPVARVIGFDLSSDVMLIVKICVGGIALFYILRGSTPSWLGPKP